MKEQKAEGRKQQAAKAKALCFVCLLPTAYCLLFVMLLLLVVSGNSKSNIQSGEVPTYTYEVVNSWPHLTSHFTQGLVYHDGHIYESTGQYGSSVLCRLDLKTGKVEQKVDVEKEYFAEGMTILRDKIYQLTWQSHKSFVYDLKNIQRL